MGFATSGYMTTIPNTVIIKGLVIFGGWDAIFYVFGCMGVIWYPIWVMYAYEDPSTHPSISPEELEFIRVGKDYVPLPLSLPLTLPLDGGEEKDSKEHCIHTGNGSNGVTGDRLHSQDMWSEGSYEVSDGVNPNPNKPNKHPTCDTDINPLLQALQPIPVDNAAIQVNKNGGDSNYHTSMGASTPIRTGTPPWRAILTHPVHLTIMLQAWAYVS